MLDSIYKDDNKILNIKHIRKGVYNARANHDYWFVVLWHLTGGLELGLEWAGLGPVKWQVEQNKYALKILEKHWPDVKRYTDIRDCHGIEYLDRLVKTWYIPLDGKNYTSKEIEIMSKLKKLLPGQPEMAVEMYKQGLSLAPIAEYFNVSRNAMWDLLRRRTEMRPQKRYGKDNHFFRMGAIADDNCQNVLEKALQRGIITRKESCEECGANGIFKDGRTAIQAHHTDYNKPLEVTWLCQKCHHGWHKENKAIAKKEVRELAQVDLICGGFP